MTVPFWCLFVACLLPYLWSATALVARVKQFGRPDNKLPRKEQAALTGWGLRAVGAHQNSWEALIVFTAAVTVSQLGHGNPAWAARLSYAFIACRILHGVAYLADIDKLRSVLFTVGYACTLGMMLLPAFG